MPGPAGRTRWPHSPGPPPSPSPSWAGGLVPIDGDYRGPTHDEKARQRGFMAPFLRKCSFTPRDPGCGSTCSVGTWPGNTRPAAGCGPDAEGKVHRSETGSGATFRDPAVTRCLSRRKAVSSECSQKDAVTPVAEGSGTGDGPGPASGPPQGEFCGPWWLGPFIMTLLPLDSGPGFLPTPARGSEPLHSNKRSPRHSKCPTCRFQ